MDSDLSRRILHAPNIHTGGGLTLLKLLLATLPSNVRWMQCDERARHALELSPAIDVTYVAPRLWSRLCADWRLRAKASASDVVLCLHSLPPLFRCKARVIVFLHSRLLVSAEPLHGYPWRTRMRLRIERFWLQRLRHHANLFVVQTPSMANALRRTVGDAVPIQDFLFAPVLTPTMSADTMRYDFVYPATGDAHKNHATLLQAWQLMAQSGCRPSLALTVDATRYVEIAHAIEQAAQEGLNITNLGVVAANDMVSLYCSSRALIFPSYTESLGLPLLEAQQCGLPILAAERDYVRDIVTPMETFDPDSALSIARAVLRHVGKPMACSNVENAGAFWDLCVPQKCS